MPYGNAHDESTIAALFLLVLVAACSKGHPPSDAEIDADNKVVAGQEAIQEAEQRAERLEAAAAAEKARARHDHGRDARASANQASQDAAAAAAVLRQGQQQAEDDNVAAVREDGH